MPFTVSQLPITEAVYTFTPDTGAPVHIAAGQLLHALQTYTHATGARFPVMTCHMDAGLILALDRGDLGVETAHALRLPEEALEAPGIIGEWEGTHVCIDGAHRLWRRYKRGDRTFPAYVVPEALWREFIITDMPDALDYRALNKVEYRTPEFEALIALLQQIGE